MQLSSNKVLRTIARMLQIAVGLVFIIASMLKAFDPPGFAEQIASYKIIPAVIGSPLAWFFICIEFTLAIALILNLRPKLFIPLMMLVLVGFIGVTIYTMAQGIEANCGCFGNVVHRTSEQVILEDALMFASLLFAYIVLKDIKQTSSLLKVASINGVSLLMAAAVVGFSAQLPVDSIVTELKEGRYFDSWPVEGLFLDLRKDQRVVFLFSTAAPDIEQQVQQMNAIAQTESVPSAVGLITDGSQQLTTLVFQYGTAFPAGALEPRFAKSLYRKLPRTFILSDGVVKKVWNGIPSPEEVNTRFILLKK